LVLSGCPFRQGIARYHFTIMELKQGVRVVVIESESMKCPRTRHDNDEFTVCDQMICRIPLCSTISLLSPVSMLNTLFRL